MIDWKKESIDWADTSDGIGACVDGAIFQQTAALCLIAGSLEVLAGDVDRKQLKEVRLLKAARTGLEVAEAVIEDELAGTVEFDHFWGQLEPVREAIEEAEAQDLNLADNLNNSKEGTKK